ncbi:response regulator [Iningainema tapete]|uniref:Protein PatA n=1 Tax=Iningainema tapete BLCC-T55 TaxID=2748662 RepID=A0A8J6XXM0_9CYAN|nr:response regulator [Iningainema tapete]MBD2778327.1 response regulator [Iningainema tapete BLCC-T55]
MNTTPLGSYKFFQKLHPLSLLAQLTSRRATGCLKVSTDAIFWSIYLEEGKLIYASHSAQLFERFSHHIHQLSQQIPTLESAIITEVRLFFENSGNGSILQPDYQAICWLVEQDCITPSQAVILIDEMAKEVLESFLTLKEGSYEFNSLSPLDELPTFCRLDLRLLVEYCQKQIRSKQVQSPISKGGTSQIPKPRQIQVPQTQSQAGVQLPRPINFDTSGSSKDRNSAQTGSKNTYTVACIDDSPTFLNSIKNFLDENTFSVVMINDPVKALMQILRSKPDIILLDVEMPNLDGYELCSLLRRHSAFKSTPIIMVTGRTGFIDRAKARMVRASGYLTKPFTQSDLLKIVFKHISLM